MVVNVKNRDGVIVLKPCGLIIGHASDELRQVVKTQLQDASESTNFLFDFADCPRIDSSGAGVLLEFRLSIMQKGGTIGVTNLSNSINNYFVMAKLTTAFKHFNSENEAIVNLRTIGQ